MIIYRLLKPVYEHRLPVLRKRAFLFAMRRNPDTFDQSRATLIKANEAIADIFAPIPGANPNLIPIPIVIPAQAKNMFLNGDLSHSVCTWNDSPPPTGDRNDECAWFFSNTAPALGQVLDTTTS